VAGVKEMLQAPLYDSFFIPEDRQTFAGAMTDPRAIRFFVDVQAKTRLETNLQASGMLPSMNTFEARAMRVVIAGPKEQFEAVVPDPDDPTNTITVTVMPDEFLTDLIYNSVISLIVGEKVMIEMPTFFFPAGAGISPGSSAPGAIIVTNHGDPNPLATFRFAEPVPVEQQQALRVEMAFPRGVPPRVAQAPRPVQIWVVLDGYLTRDVQ
jgi:hypothetical protein